MKLKALEDVVTCRTYSRLPWGDLPSMTWHPETQSTFYHLSLCSWKLAETVSYSLLSMPDGDDGIPCVMFRKIEFRVCRLKNFRVLCCVLVVRLQKISNFSLMQIDQEVSSCYLKPTTARRPELYSLRW